MWATRRCASLYRALVVTPRRLLFTPPFVIRVVVLVVFESRWCFESRCLNSSLRVEVGVAIALIMATVLLFCD